MSMPQSKLCLVLGAGGVGKTSCSASLALALASEGHKTVVITIDPAKRLAQALGLEKLSNDTQLIKKYENGGEVHAVWLDNSTAFDQLVRKKISSPDLANKIVNNRLYTIIKEQLGGIEEYLAVDRLLSLGKSGDFDICILDTPPSRHALDFIESPEHLLQFFDESILRIFLRSEEEDKPGFFERIVKGTRSQALLIFKKFLGNSFMNELSELLSQSQPVHQSLRETADSVKEWVRSDQTRSVIVATPEKYPLDESHLLSSELYSHGLSKANLLLLNRCLPEENPEDPQLIHNLLGSDLAQALLEQQEKQKSLLADFPAEKISPNLARIRRYSSSQLGIETLTQIGKDIVSQWRKSEPSTFSKSS